MRPVLKGSDPWKRVWRCQEGRKNQTEGKAPEEQENETSSSEEVNSIELKADIAEMLPRVRDLVLHDRMLAPEAESPLADAGRLSTEQAS
ncbi:hypothetical protein V6N13_133607 [Hibiscus sabdariffa]